MIEVMERGNFEEAYAKLNVAQREAVDTIEGPVMVIAGPGTGKTQILTMRIANICRLTDTEPENVLALTFTEAAAASMRRRLVDLMGSGAYAVTISTFHGFCNDIIRIFPEEFPKLIGAEPMDDAMRIRLVSEIIEELPLKILKPFHDHGYYVPAAMKAMSDLKREGVSPDELDGIVKDEAEGFELIDDLYHDSGAHKGKKKNKYAELEKAITKRKELLLIYRRYEERLIAERLYDYDDMIAETYRALSVNEDLLLSLQERYHYILVDEHQDTNRAQNRIVELIANFHDNPNVFVVGDDKQAIFRFQGASLENFYYFKKLYPEAKIIALEENYRSTQTILDIAHGIIAGVKELKARGNNPEEKIRVYAFSGENFEERFIAGDIRKKIEGGVQPEEIAILYRENRDALKIAEALENEGIPYAVEPGESILYDHGIRKLTAILEAIDCFGDQRLAIAAMHVDFFGIDPFDIFKIISYAENNKVSVFEPLSKPEVLTALALSDPEKVAQFYHLMKRWAIMAKNNALPRLFEDVVARSGMIAKAVSSSESIEDLERINGLFRELKNFITKNRRSTLGDFLGHLRLMEEHGVSIAKMLMSPAVKKVRLMTAHRSKGLEFEYVYIVRAVHGKWGGKRSRKVLPLPSKIYSLSGRSFEEEDETSDERRLFYVALTRAKRSIAVTYARMNADGREQTPSQFITEMKEELLDYPDTREYETVSPEDIRMFHAEKRATELGFSDKNLIREIVMRKGLSPTDINNYLVCPWRYFYNGLFRVPQAMNKYNMFGSAVHAAIEDYFRVLKEEGDKGKEFVIARFLTHLSDQPLSAEEYRELEEKGRMALSGFIDKYAGTWGLNALAEFSVRGVDVDGIPVKGRIDRLEILNSGEVRVTDFKTGKPKTRGQIEGKTKDSNGEIKRQIVFYKLLLDGYQSSKYKLSEAVIDFVEPDEKGNYHREVFVPGEEDVHILEEEIKRVFDEVTNLTFLDRRCGKKDCEYCELRDLSEEEPMKAEYSHSEEEEESE